MLGVEFRRFACVMGCVLCVAVRGVCMVSRGFVIAGLVMLSGFTMMACCVFVMLCRLIVMVRCFLRHVGSPLNTNNRASRPKSELHAGSEREHTLFSRRWIRQWQRCSARGGIEPPIRVLHPAFRSSEHSEQD